MAFLAPVLLSALLALAIPVLVHLVQRERRRVVPFPSLMFLRKIPNQAVKRRAIRHWPLMAARMAAIGLLALAFARPYLAGGSAIAAGGGGREVVVLLDRSASMGFADRWDRARREARRVIDDLGPADRGTFVLFDVGVDVGPRSVADRAPLMAAVSGATLSSAGTRFGPVLRAAAGLLESSRLPQRDVVLISDFQRNAWDPSQDARLPDGVVLRTISVADGTADHASIAGIGFDRQPAARGERVTASVRVVNRSASPIRDRDLFLEVDGHRIDTRRVSIDPHGVAVVPCEPFVLAAGAARVTARLAPDALAADDVFHATVSAEGRVPVLIVDGANPSPDASLYVGRALAVSTAPAFEVKTVRVDALTPAAIADAAVVVLNDTRPPDGAVARALDAHVRRGGGLFVALGERAVWPAGAPDLLPGTLGPLVDRAGSRGGSLGFVDYGHAVFEIFGQPRSGDLAAARIFRYRTLTEPVSVLARFDDGGVAVAERRVGEGIVMAWTSTLDGYWNDLALEPVFLPFLVQAMKHLGRIQDPKASYVVGDLFDPAGASAVGQRAAATTFTVVAPTGDVRAWPGAEGGAPLVLSHPGFYEFKATAGGVRAPLVAAVNTPGDESDLAALDPVRLASAVTAHGSSAADGSAQTLTATDVERQQSGWWYLVAAALALFVVEGVMAGRLALLGE